MQHCFACDLVEAKCRVARLPDNRPDFSGGNVGLYDHSPRRDVRSPASWASNPFEWTSSQLSAWLLTRGMPGEIAHAFEVHLVNGQLASELDEADLRSMGIKHPLHQRRVQREMFDLFGTQPAGMQPLDAQPQDGPLRGPPFAADIVQELANGGITATFPVKPPQPPQPSYPSQAPAASIIRPPATPRNYCDPEKPRRGRRPRPRSAGAVVASTPRTPQKQRPPPWFVKGAARRIESARRAPAPSSAAEQQHSDPAIKSLYMELAQAEDMVARLRSQLLSHRDEGMSNQELRESLAQSQMEVKELRMASSSRGSLLGEISHQRSPEMVEWLMRTSEAARVSDWTGPHQLGPEYVDWLSKEASYRLLRRLPRQSASLEGL